MKKFFFLIMVIAVLGMLNVATTMTANGNKGSTAEGNYYKTFDAPELTIVSDAIAIDGTTVNLVRIGAISINEQAKENGYIEQGVMKEISPQSSMIMTSDLRREEAFKYKSQQTGITTMNQNTTQMSGAYVTQWRNHNLNALSMSWRPNGCLNALTAVPRIFITNADLTVKVSGVFAMKEKQFPG